MNRNTSCSSLSLSESPALNSSYYSPISASAPIIPLRAAHENEGSLISDILSILTEEDVNCLHEKYQISREIFCIFAPSPSVRIEDQIHAEGTIIVYEEQLKAGLQFSMDLFFTEVLYPEEVNLNEESGATVSMSSILGWSYVSAYQTIAT